MNKKKEFGLSHSWENVSREVEDFYLSVKNEVDEKNSKKILRPYVSKIINN